MNIKRRLNLSIILIMGLFWVGAECMAGQETGQTTNTDPSSVHISTSMANAVAIDPVFEFEPVLEGETVTHVFVIKNTGTDELKILKVRTG